MISRATSIFMLVVGCLTATLSFAADKTEIKKIENELAQKQQQAEKLHKNRTVITAELTKLRSQLVAAAAAERAHQQDMRQLEARMAALRTQTADEEKNWQEKNRQHAAALAALTRLSRLPPEAAMLQTSFAANGQSALADHWHTALLLRTAIPALQQQAESARLSKSKLDDLQTEMNQKQAELYASRQRLDEQQNNLGQLLAERQKLADRTGADYAVLRRDVARLGREAADLRQLLDKVSRRVPGSKLERRAQPRDNMVLPVAGNLQAGFGNKDQFGVTSRGATWRAPAGTRIVAPRGGKIVFAGLFRGYGEIVIIEHPGDRHSLLAGFGRIDVAVGDRVERGEPLGALPATSGNQPELYFELRANGEPIDPLQ
jgi:murein hydrolase activator